MGMSSANVSITAGRWPTTSSQSSRRHFADLTLSLLQVAEVPHGQPPIAGRGGDVGFGDGILWRSDWLAKTVES
jgi:hypothetical protein